MQPLGALAVHARRLLLDAAERAPVRMCTCGGRGSGAGRPIGSPRSCPHTLARAASTQLRFHCDTDGFAMTSVGVLTAPAVTGPYTWVGQCFRPDGHASYDMGTYYDDPAHGGDGQMVRTRARAGAHAWWSREINVDLLY